MPHPDVRLPGVHVYGRKAVRLPALHVLTQAEMSAITHELATVAIVKLARHRYTGAARIEVDQITSADWAITLSDERGEWAALSIEYGRRPNKHDKGMEGLDILGSLVRGDWE